MERATKTSHCHQHTLAKGGTAHLQSCSECGTVSMHVGAITLRFDPASLESLWNTLGEALLTLHSERHNDGPYLPTVRPRGTA